MGIIGCNFSSKYNYLIELKIVSVTPRIITIAKYYFSENKTIEPGLILEPRVNW